MAARPRRGRSPGRRATTAEQVAAPTTTTSWPRCSTTTGRRRPTTTSGRSRSTSAASTTPVTASTRSPAAPEPLPYGDGPRARRRAPASSRSTSSRPGSSTRSTSPTCRRAWSRRPRPTPSSSASRVEGRVADAERIPYDDNTFDIVVGHAVIHHIPDVEAAFARDAAGAQARWPVRHRRRADHGGRLVRPQARPADLEGDQGRHPAAAPARARGPRTRRRSTSPRAPRRWRRSSTCTPSTPTSSPAWPCAPAPSACGPGPRSSRRPSSAGRCAPSRRRCKPGALGWGWAMFAYGSWQRLSAVDRVLAQAVPGPVLLQRRHHRREARLRTDAAGSDARHVAGRPRRAAVPRGAAPARWRGSAGWAGRWPTGPSPATTC